MGPLTSWEAGRTRRVSGPPAAGASRREEKQKEKDTKKNSEKKEMKKKSNEEINMGGHVGKEEKVRREASKKVERKIDIRK